MNRIRFHEHNVGPESEYWYRYRCIPNIYTHPYTHTYVYIHQTHATIHCVSKLVSGLKGPVGGDTVALCRPDGNLFTSAVSQQTPGPCWEWAPRLQNADCNELRPTASRNIDVLHTEHKAMFQPCFRRLTRPPAIFQPDK